MMRLFKYIIIHIFLLVIVSSCSQNSSMQIDITHLQSLDYKIYKDKVEVGFLSFTFRNIEQGLQIVEEKGFSAEFLSGLDKDVKNIKIYNIDHEFSLINYKEEEYLDGELYYKINQSVTEDNKFKKVVIKVDEKEKNKIYFPPDEKIYTNAMRSLMFLFNQEMSIENYYFFTNSEGFIEYNYVLGEESIDTVLGERKAFKVFAETPKDTYYWIDKKSGVMLKSENHLDKNIILTTVLTKRN